MLVTALFLVAFLATVPEHIGDTYWCGSGISSVLTGQGMANHGQLWEFAHPLWRPLVYLLYKVFGSSVASFRGPDVTANVIWVMMAVSALSGWLCCLFLHRVLVKICGYGGGLLLAVFAESAVNHGLIASKLRGGTAKATKIRKPIGYPQPITGSKRFLLHSQPAYFTRDSECRAERGEGAMPNLHARVWPRGLA